ncbi:uncharacterized protein RJT21DRAFT_121541 [Scheffersomyces amazonensis]|uniref:uncharacterized protein n=1 Tax=Scheffersomyces amazonensis TaxID=1078765 RepID=UPI00315D69FB
MTTANPEFAYSSGIADMSVIRINKENSEILILEEQIDDESHSGNYKQSQLQPQPISSMLMDTSDTSMRSKSKRGPSTPLTPSLQQQNIVRRKLIHPNQSPTKSKSFNKLTINEESSTQLVDTKLENWQLAKELARSKEIIKFLQLESELAH